MSAPGKNMAVQEQARPSLGKQQKARYRGYPPPHPHIPSNPAGSTFRRVVPRKREVSGSVGATLRLTELVELGLRPIRTIYARKNLRRAPFDIWLKSAFSWVHHTHFAIHFAFAFSSLSPLSSQCHPSAQFPLTCIAQLSCQATREGSVPDDSGHTGRCISSRLDSKEEAKRAAV